MKSEKTGDQGSGDRGLGERRDLGMTREEGRRKKEE